MTLAIGKENAQRKNVCSPSIKKWEVSPLPVKLAVVRFVLLVILKLFLNWLQAKQTDESTLLTQTASSTEIEVYKKRLNQLTLSPSFNHQLSSTFLPFSNFASRLLRLLFSHPPPPPPQFLYFSRFFLVGLCCPQGVWDSFGDLLYVSWPELQRWGYFDGSGIIHPVRWAVQHWHTAAAAHTYCMYIYADTDFLRSKL